MKQYSNKKLKAFTLVELIVSISIVSFMAIMSISSYPKFSEQIKVTSESYKVLAYVKEVQVFGSSSYTAPGVKTVYGVEIDKVLGTLKRVRWENPTSELNGDYINNKVDTGEETLVLKDIFEIEKFCHSDICEDDVDKAFVFFKRPNPEARILTQEGTNILPTNNTNIGHDKLEIYIRSKKNNQFIKKVVILQTGQIYVEEE